MTEVSDPGLNGRTFTAAQSFMLGSKLYWTKTLYPSLRHQYEIAEQRSPASTQSVTPAEQLEHTVDYHIYAWLERHLQRFKYSGRYGLQPYHNQQREILEEHLATDRLPEGLLELTDDLELPTYYTGTDIHQHPGGVWSDPIAGYVYERGARSTTPVMGKRHEDLHERLVNAVDAVSSKTPNTILDMACGFGKSTTPFFERYRDAEITGIDLSAPCLKLAARDAAERQVSNVRYKQRNAYDTGFDDNSFDLVTSTMLLHEMPPPKILETFDEAARVLKPGGVMMHLDFHELPDAFGRFIHYGHARRNNEPFMKPFAEMNVQEVLESKGFKNVTVRPYAEDDGVLDKNYSAWRFPWTLITAEKPHEDTNEASQ